MCHDVLSSHDVLLAPMPRPFYEHPDKCKPTLAYWNTRCLDQSIRNLLIYKGVEFQNRRFEFGHPLDFQNSEWLEEKFTSGLTFPSLSYYKDGSVKLTQSLAILQHLARKYDLVGRYFCIFISGEKDMN